MINNFWSIGGLLIAFLIIFVFYTIYEKRNTSNKEIALISTLAALSGLSRVSMMALPNIQPMTALVLICGHVYGPIWGFIIGATATLVSNVFIGHGPWTIWQMLAWGLVGLTGGIIRIKNRRFLRLVLTTVAFIWGFIFGWIMNIFHWLAYVYPLNLSTYIAVNLTSFPFDLSHAISNGVFIYFVGTEITIILERFRKKLNIIKIENSS